MKLRHYIYALAAGGGLGLAWSAAERALVYKAYFQQDYDPFSMSGKNRTVMCTKHAGNGLLMWSNGDLQCHECGVEKYGNTEVKARHERLKNWDSNYRLEAYIT